MNKKQRTHRLWVPDHLTGLIRRMHPHLKRKVRAAMEAIGDDPRSGKALRDELEGLRSFRVGAIRIIYRMPGKQITEIVAIGPRKSIYEQTFRLLRNEWKAAKEGNGS